MAEIIMQLLKFSYARSLQYENFHEEVKANNPKANFLKQLLKLLQLLLQQNRPISDSPERENYYNY